MKKTYKFIALLSTTVALAACQSGEKKVDETSAQTTVIQATTQAPTTTATTTQSAKSNQTGEATYEHKEPGVTVTLKYYYKDDVVYKQEGTYVYNPKEMGQDPEQFKVTLQKAFDETKGVKGIEGSLEFKDGVYTRKNTFDYNTMDFVELNKRNPKKYPAKNVPLYYSEAVKKLEKNGYVKK